MGQEAVSVVGGKSVETGQKVGWHEVIVFPVAVHVIPGR